jgi:hypothetical protein
MLELTLLMDNKVPTATAFSAVEAKLASDVNPLF